jgi:hypothetical protein
VDIGIDLLRGHGQDGNDERRCARSDFRGNPPLKRIPGDKAASVRGLTHFGIVLKKNDFRMV